MRGVWNDLAGLVGLLDKVGLWLPQLGLRLVLAYEFGVAGLEKLGGSNWFAEIQGQFPFPFNHVPVDVTWYLALAIELIAPLALVLGLGTRLFSSLLVALTLVAIAAVHAGHGYNVCDNGWKLPLLYLAMLLPLLFSGPGRLSIDHLLHQRHQRTERSIWR